ncbi:InlB B-repeat-containing protein [[Clostridium] polysaccharolyticum]|jgi:uncharacterized repeat protein (TIGR02543 family)|uniref:Listeria/Bacterioides repeat-containing protein n=1 Tax=[Clostridium] polysaccharolyticum TaxID=29364 RepID=A0A1I0D8J4_9FIRM|nr:InlB B-repeat-containing protein [[Clostridium] polysaccharolyticum]SET28388.1 Listeria/Bacterioides repeat-containing protein [[Clostridium] polysaccharolyticum]
MKKQKSVWLVLLAILLFATTCVQPDNAKAASIKDTVFYVQFNTNGGSSVAAITNVRYGSTIDEPDNPSRSGYWFRGWYTDSSLTSKFDFSQKIYRNTTIYAGWEKQSSTPHILSQSISDGTYHSTVTVDITGQQYGNACEMQLMTYERSILKTVVFTQNKTTKYIGFELNIADLVFQESSPLPVKIKLPSSFSKECVQVIYTTNRKSVSGIPEGYVNSNNEFVFDAYYSGTYILMETVDNVKAQTDPKPHLAIRCASNKIKLNRQMDLNYALINYNDDESQYDFKWYSSKPYIASVSKEGVLTAKRPGQTVISCVSTNSRFVASKTITVYGHLVKSIKTNISTKKLKKGTFFNIRSTISPSNATVKRLRYTSSKKTVASISKSGRITAKKRGICYIKVSAADGSGKYKRIKIIVV